MNAWHNLWRLCVHGEARSHAVKDGKAIVWLGDEDAVEWCPGGSAMTATDLEALGVKDWYCDKDYSITAIPKPACQNSRDPHHESCGFRLLIPIPTSAKP